MKHIIKNGEPNSFQPWKVRKHYTKVELQSIPNLTTATKKNILKKNTIWKDFTGTGKNGVNGDVKKGLLNEQGFICCYCMSRIEIDDATIEHLASRSVYPTEMFDYSTNLLASCNGGEKDTKPKDPHCGASKSNQGIQINPFQPNCHIHFHYDYEGNITGTTNEGKDTIKKLGLDIAKLKSRRRIAIENILDPAIDLTEADVISLINAMTQRMDNKFYPYCQTIINILSN
jgi:uncharacterized protein (TIGR02646 family)